MIISAIVAASENDIIGRDGDLPWRLPKDLKWFKSKTLGHHVIMGRTSFESLPKPLPNRVNIVVTRDQSYYHSDIVVCHSLHEALAYAHEAGDDEAFVIGGGTIYQQTKDLWDRLYLTRVHEDIEGDTKFPSLGQDQWSISFEEKHYADVRHKYDYTFFILDKKIT